MLPDPVDFARDAAAKIRRAARQTDPRDVALVAAAGVLGAALGYVAGGGAGRRQIRALTSALKTAEADAESARRVAARDVADAKKFGAQKLASSLFGVADSLQLARTAAGADTAAYEALDAQLHAALAAQSVEAYAPAPGEPFDPATMEALRAVAPPTGGRAVVDEVLQRGYVLHDRVIRA
eukprot:CAMPEP_0119259402 /NCGR_PEP_ID=MMETSP1329-20130426/239_1 /TAXON_ID=114041 /ORGANISM="Genus nov. species nov., Strain RCC1024" /LENGTH=180 /DNA_ID=CAMNT_0007258783 /DNA_START=614 /DNA_END=1152 /DNA_ORIENTATION=+